MLRSLLKDWNYSWNKYCNLLSVAMCHSQFPLLIFLASSWHQKTKIALWKSLQNKKKLWTKRLIEEKWLVAISKGFIRKNLNKKTFLSFSFLINCCMTVFFSFLIKSFVNLEKLIRFHQQAFIIYKNGENLKIVKEMFRQKLYFLTFFGFFRPSKT